MEDIKYIKKGKTNCFREKCHSD